MVLKTMLVIFSAETGGKKNMFNLMDSHRCVSFDIPNRNTRHAGRSFGVSKSLIDKRQLVGGYGNMMNKMPFTAKLVPIYQCT